MNKEIKYSTNGHHIITYSDNSQKISIDDNLITLDREELNEWIIILERMREELEKQESREELNISLKNQNKQEDQENE